MFIRIEYVCDMYILYIAMTIMYLSFYMQNVNKNLKHTQKEENMKYSKILSMS